MRSYRNILYGHALNQGYIQKEQVTDCYGIPILKGNLYDIYSFARQTNALPKETIKKQGELETLLN